MLPYYLLICMPLGLIAFGKIARISVSHKRVILLFFLIVFAILSLRDVTCGTDLKTYQYYFEEASKEPFAGGSDIEYGYVVLESIVSKIIPDFQFFLSVVAFFSLFPIFVLYKKESEIPFLTIVLFLTVAPFSMYFSGLRQVCAMAFSVPAYFFAKNKQFFWFAITVVIACSFHQSAFVIGLLYPVYHFRINRTSLLWVSPLIAVVFAFNGPIFGYLLKLLSERYVERYSFQENTGAYTILFLLLLFTAYCFILPRETKLDDEVIGLRNLLLLSVVIQCFAPVHSLAMRMNYYYLMFIPILIPKIAKRSSLSNQSIAQTSVVVMCSFFAVYFIYNGYTSDDILSIFPYIPFWKG